MEDNQNNQANGNVTPPKTVTLREGETVIDQKVLEGILKKQAEIEISLADKDAKYAGLQAIIESGKDADTVGEKKLRERKDFEPQFRTVRIRKYPIKGDVTNPGYVIGWTDRGAYQTVDRSGVSAAIVDKIDIIFLGHERNEQGVLQAESVPLLDFLNRGEQVHCKVLEIKDWQGKPFRPSYPSTGQGERKIRTGEEIQITIWDPKHGLVASGETIDGYVGVTDISFVIQIPGIAEPVEIDGKYVN